MIKCEKKLLEWVEKNIDICFFICMVIVGMIIRYVLRNGMSDDSTYCLIPWYDEIVSKGKINALQYQIGNYNMLYQFLIVCMTYLPINSLYAYKILSIMFDVLLAAASMILLKKISVKYNRNYGGILFLLVWLSPIVIINSSYWGQCDSIYVFWIIFSLILLIDEKYYLSLSVLGIAFAFKLQTMFVLPIFLFVYFVKKSFSLLGFGIIPITMIGCCLPNIIIGKRTILDVFKIYFEQTDWYKKISCNYSSIWLLLSDNNLDEMQYEMIKKYAILVAVVVLAGIMFFWLKKSIVLIGRNIIYMTFIMAYTCVLFLPSMHDRYTYLIEILAILICFLNKKTIIGMIGMYIITLMSYGSFLFGKTINLGAWAIINLIIYIFYLYLLNKELLEDSIKTESN